MWTTVRGRPAHLFYALAGLATGTVFAQAPRIDSLSPGQVPIAGGTAISIRGANFTNATVSIDKAAVTATSIAFDEIRFTALKHDNGYAIVRVSTGAGTATARVLYIPPSLKDLPPGYITTIAGVGLYYGDYGPAREAAVAPVGIDYGPDGSLYVAEAQHNRVIRIRADGVLEPFAGTGQFPKPGVSPDGGPATAAGFGFPRSVVVESNGDVIIADSDTNRVYRVDAATGTIRTIAGTGVAGFSGDGGPATEALLNHPTHLAGDKAGTLWVVDFGNARIRRITPDGKIATICGTGTAGFSGDGGPAIEAQFNDGIDDAGVLAYDPAGVLYLSDYANQRIRRIDLGTGIIDTFVGPDRDFGADIAHNRALTVGPDGNLYFSPGSEIVRVTRDGQLVERFGARTSQPTFDGTPLANAKVGGIGLVLDAQGNIVYTDQEIHRVMRLNRISGVQETVAGVGPGVFGENGPALAASPVEKSGPFPDLIVLPTGEIVFSGQRIRKIGLDGRLSVVAFTGSSRTEGEDIPATQASETTGGLHLDAQGNLYAATFNHVVVIDTQGIVRRFAGLLTPLQCDYSGDGGPARNARLCQPWDVVMDGDGNAFIADTNNNRIRRVDAKTGVITTVVGSGPVNGFEGYNTKGSYCGDGGPAIEACLNTPEYLAVNSQGELYINEGGHFRKVDRNGIISTISTAVNPAFMAVDAADNILFTGLSSAIGRLTPGGVVQKIAATGAQGFSGDGGPALSALAAPGGGVGFDAEGNLYFVDGQNRRIRAVRYGAVLAPPNARAQIASGTPQTAPIATRFSDPLAVIVLDNTGQPAGNVRVDFTAPASGASCTTATASVLTDRNGRAEFVCNANTVAGSFNVTATPLGSNITLTFALANTAPRLASNGLVNGASFLGGPVAPGEIVTIFGAGVGPVQLVQAAPVEGRFATQLAGVRVLFNGTESPVLFARFDQVAVIAPYALDGAASAQVVVEFAGVASNTIAVPVAQVSPAIFSANSSGRGQGAILNQDNSVNSAANPADQGSIIVLFCTGEGQTDPPGVDGKLANDVYPKPKLPVSVMIGGQMADILYYGAAPTLVAGVMQVNARVPNGITSGSAVPVSIGAGTVSSPSGITVAIR
ncbi:MAG TPA: IPT/TIG domain-containing protein [Bryobacteraceae bacterium]|nr:IPT/TIG domain-containing protein [Bryobacteraceae bacterium]